MNKLMGFYELKDLDIPTIHWKIFNQDTRLDKDLLWTIRVAVKSGDDLNLPRVVGVTNEEAEAKGRLLLEAYEGKGIVIYYPYFIAVKSGVIDMHKDRTVIEAVEKDLWNLVTHGKKNVTVIITGTGSEYYGDSAFLTAYETSELIKYGSIIKSRYREVLNVGKSLLAEWSFAYNTDARHQPIGEKYLVFYELRSV
ncbi:MAG: hypothetical protein ACM3TR_08970 [Caulobacteraceae bacterium]